MLLQFIVAAGIIAFIAHWLIPAIRKRNEYEIEFGCATACLWASIYLLCFNGQSLVLLLSLPRWVRIGGVILWLLSMLLFIASIFFLRTRGKPKRGWEETTELSAYGVHGLVRHPMQLAAVLGAAGITLMKLATPVVILCVSSAVLAVRAAFAEDKYNISKFGEQYREYMGTVPRLNLCLGILRRIVHTGQVRRDSR
jgi:protein-S-isoprenylcysteine O-methyltransferase Ste14